MSEPSEGRDPHVTNIPMMWTMEGLVEAHKEADGTYKELLAGHLEQAMQEELLKDSLMKLPYEDKIEELGYLLSCAVSNKILNQIWNKIMEERLHLDLNAKKIFEKLKKDGGLNG